MLYERAARPLLFRLDPERVHDAAIGLGRLASIAPMRWLISRWFGFADPRLRTDVAGLSFPDPLGLAAGFDKNGLAVRALAALGFGHVEIGSVSAAFSAGNARPRLFRLPADAAIVVHYGLPNLGARAVARRLAGGRGDGLLGINVVKTNRGHGAPDETAEGIQQDYLDSLGRLRGVADYFTLNLSCPNTENGRNHFADARNVDDLVRAVDALALRQPVFLKVSPLGGVHAMDELLDAVSDAACVAGFCFNLAPGIPPGLRTPAAVTGPLPGSVAGRPVRRQLEQRTRELYARMDRRRYVLISAGGVSTAAHAYARIRAGASLVQLLSSLVYEGPGVVRRIKRGLVTLLERDGLSSVQQAVGVDVTGDPSASPAGS